jgi:hypothetical protein
LLAAGGGSALAKQCPVVAVDTDDWEDDFVEETEVMTL